MRYFIADTHFNDPKAFNFEKRPFVSIEQMNDKIVQNWNSVVKPGDEVFLLGDVIGGNDVSDNTQIEKLKNIMMSLSGKITIVLGNHDGPIIDYLKEWGFEISRYPIIIDNYWILSHEPQYLIRDGLYANIFGHVHGNPMYKDYSNRSFCVSVERINYTPISFEQIKKKMKEVDEAK